MEPKNEELDIFCDMCGEIFKKKDDKEYIKKEEPFIRSNYYKYMKRINEEVDIYCDMCGETIKTNNIK